jgi:hypothetical protein
MNTALLAHLTRIQSELNAIMMELASAGAPPPDSVPVIPVVPVDEKKGPGRPRKEKKERDPNKPKKVLSPEHLAKLKEGRDLAVAKKAAEKASASDDAASAASSDTEDGEVKVVLIEAPGAPKKGRGRPPKVTVEPIPAPDFSAADDTK